MKRYEWRDEGSDLLLSIGAGGSSTIPFVGFPLLLPLSSIPLLEHFPRGLVFGDWVVLYVLAYSSSASIQPRPVIRHTQPQVYAKRRTIKVKTNSSAMRTSVPISLFNYKSNCSSRLRLKFSIKKRKKNPTGFRCKLKRARDCLSRGLTRQNTMNIIRVILFHRQWHSHPRRRYITPRGLGSFGGTEIYYVT